ncbi:hypothetical protein EVAR_38972_1 [Eumeta japonica]|uniref:Uncharacterized protein n=1 Tax=Eumeta variegata TaxID=151549 RepID=A0A4C1W905_EUMVA|nr:hypothetical protein EVAR_38972_1 [Eumeta japonica]
MQDYYPIYSRFYYCCSNCCGPCGSQCGCCAPASFEVSLRNQNLDRKQHTPEATQNPSVDTSASKSASVARLTVPLQTKWAWCTARVITPAAGRLCPASGPVSHHASATIPRPSPG